MRDFVADLRYALRTLARRPAFSLPLVVVLALGIAGATTMFSVLYGVVLRPLPFPDPDRIVTLTGATYPDMSLWGSAPSVEHIAIYSTGGVNLRGATTTERIQAAEVTLGFFSVFGVTPQVGRAFLDDDLSGAEQVVLISDGLWTRNFARSTSILNQILYINHVPHVIAGVMPQGFGFPGRTDLWMPVAEQSPWRLLGAPDQPDLPLNLTTNMVARLRAGATLMQTRSEMEVLRLQLKERLEGTRLAVTSSVGVRNLHQSLVGEMQTPLLVLFAATGFLLLIACVNAAGLLLARGVEKQKEVAVRLCLGAGRWRILQQLLAESALLASVGGATGILLGYASVYAVRAFGPRNVPRLSEVSLDLTTLAFAVGATLLVGLIW